MMPEPTLTSGSAGSGIVVRHFFTTRSGGVSAAPYNSLNLGGGVGDDPAAVAANRARVAATADLPTAALVWMHQVHGTTVTTVRQLTLGSRGGGAVGEALPPSDGVVTSTVGVGLAVLVADCVPILARDSNAGVIAAVHAGRRGAADGIALRALEAMVAAGSQLSSVDVILGPAICGACYEVPESMRDEVDAALPGSASTTDKGTPGLDLRAGIAIALRGAGVRSVVVDPRCTNTDPDLFSHRRGAPTGRLAGVIWMSS